MKKISKIMCLGLSILIVFLMSVSCTKKDEDENAKIGDEDKRLVLTIDGKDILYDEFRYYFMNFKKDFESGNANFWVENKDKQKELNEAILSTLRTNYAILNLAKKHKLELSDEDKANIESTITSMVSSFGDESTYQLALDEYYMTETLYRSILEIDAMESKLYDYITDEVTGTIKSDDATVTKDINENFVRSISILITNDEGDDIAANKKLADDLLTRLNNGEDFMTLMAEHSEDDTMTENVDGYYFTKGEMLTAFEDKAFELKIDEISSVVESPIGFHIIKRLELDPNYIDKNFETLRTTFMTREFYTTIDNTAKDLDVKLTDFYSTLNVDIMS